MTPIPQIQQPRCVIDLRFRRAFTLVELLAVIAIIAILASILIPVVSSVRKNAKQAVSVGNLRSIGIAIGLFVVENKGHLPQSSDAAFTGEFWTDSELRPYLPPSEGNWHTVRGEGAFYEINSVFIDPTLDSGRHHPISDYGCNTKAFLKGQRLLLSTVRSPSKLVLVASASYRPDGREAGSWYFDGQAYVDGRGVNTFPSTRGTGRFLATFADGHTAAVPEDEFYKNRRTHILPDPQW